MKRSFIDEAHHLKNRASRTWKFVNELQRKFILLLTATPNLIPPGEWVVSNDEALVFHVGHGFRDWLQGDVTLGALPVPAAAEAVQRLT